MRKFAVIILAVFGMMAAAACSEEADHTSYAYTYETYNNDTTYEYSEYNEYNEFNEYNEYNEYNTEINQVEGAGSSETAPAETYSEYSGYTEVEGYIANGEDGACEVYEETEIAWSENNQTAPMPEAAFSESDLIGTWVDDPSSETPMVLEFYWDNGQLRYVYYKIMLGNGYGFNLANEFCTFDYCKGNVSVQANQGRVLCLNHSSEAYLALYYGFDGYDTMTDQTDGTPFYRYNGTLNAVYDKYPEY